MREQCCNHTGAGTDVEQGAERTVAKHIENILSKLSFSSRAQIAVWPARGSGAPIVVIEVQRFV